MLSRKQFLDKHAAKFAGLSRVQKDKRYNDYQSSSSSAPRKFDNVRRDMRTNRSLNRLRNNPLLGGEEYNIVRTEMLSQYLKSLVDPWNNKAHYPDPMAYQGVPIQIKSTRIIRADDKGNFAFILRPGITRHISLSAENGDSLTNLTAAGYRGLVPVPDTAFFYVNHPTDPVTGTGSLVNDQLDINTSLVRNVYSKLDGIQNSNWLPVQSWEEVRSTGVAWRAVSGGVKMSYEAARRSAQGSIVVAPYHQGYGFPDAATDLSGNVFPHVWSFEGIAALEGAETYTVNTILDEPVEAIFVPYGTTNEFKPTKYEQAFYVAQDDFKSSQVLTGTDPACCDMDTDTYLGLLTGASSASAGLSLATGLQTSCPMAATIAPAPTAISITPNRLEVGVNHNTFAGIFASAGLMQDQTLSGDMTSIVVMGSGLESNTTGTDVFRIETVLNIELIPDSRAFSAVSIEKDKAPMILDSVEMEGVRHLANKLPTVVNKENIAKTVGDITETLPTLVAAGSAAAGKIGKLFGSNDLGAFAIPNLGESPMSATGLADVMGEVGGVLAGLL